MNKEREHPREIRYLNELYPLLCDNWTTRQSKAFPGVNQFFSQFVLQINNSLAIPIEINMIASASFQSERLTPMDPSLGYQIDDNDLNIEQRAEKIARLSDSTQNEERAVEEILSVMICSSMSELANWDTAGQLELGQFENSSEANSILSRLQVQVFFPGNSPGVAPSNWAALPEEICLLAGQVYYMHYFPLERGPLATTDDFDTKGFGLREGLELYVPSNIEKLKRVRTKFVLLSGEETQVPEVFRQGF